MGEVESEHELSATGGIYGISIDLPAGDRLPISPRIIANCGCSGERGIGVKSWLLSRGLVTKETTP